MPGRPLAGSRIRARRTDAGIRQADLARACGISPSYLNLIEHNRRRIGGKLLVDIAQALSVDASTLSEGAGSTLVTALEAASGAQPKVAAETDRTEELAGRFPGWAALVVDQADRIATLQRTVETLADRLTHDPYLSASLHDVLSVVTAIRSTSGILADDGDIPAEWQARFHRNLYEDSQRLAQASQSLVGYLDAGADTSRNIRAPQDEVDAWLASRHFHIAELEDVDAPAGRIDAILAGAGDLESSAAHSLAATFLERYRQDARRLPLQTLLQHLGAPGIDPGRIATETGADVGVVLRRLATLPPTAPAPPMGLVICDGAGALTLRKEVAGFPLPRFGACCPLWPLFQALIRPLTPLRTVVLQPGTPERRFVTYAICEPEQPAGFDMPAVYSAMMLIVPLDGAGGAGDAVRPVGPTCRICPREACPARREPSIIGDRVAVPG